MSAKVLLICQTFTDIIRKVECYVFTRNIINLLRKGRQGTKNYCRDLLSAAMWREILISMREHIPNVNVIMFTSIRLYRIQFLTSHVNRNPLWSCQTNSHVSTDGAKKVKRGNYKFANKTHTRCSHGRPVLALPRSLPLLCHGE